MRFEEGNEEEALIQVGGIMYIIYKGTGHIGNDRDKSTILHRASVSILGVTVRRAATT